MKKLFFILVAMFVAFQATSQEFLTVEHSWIDKHGYPGVRLSNGVEVFHLGGDSKGSFYSSSRKETCRTNFKKRTKYPKGAIIYHQGTIYEFEKIIPRGTYTITKVSTREINVETQAHINGAFSYNSFLAFISAFGGGGGGKAKGSFSGSMQGGTKTVVNVFFGDGKYASITAAEDPIWLEAKPGMKIEHYTVRDVNLYKLIIR